MAIVYLITCVTSGLSYIGCTTQPLKARWSQHRCDSKKERTTCSLHKAIRDHGSDAFTATTLGRGRISDMLLLESEKIAEFGTLAPNGYNLESGGSCDYIVSPETRAKMSVSAKRRCEGVDMRPRLDAARKKRWASDNPGGPSTEARKLGARKRKDATSQEDVDTIRDMHANGTSYAQIARETGVGYCTVRNIALGLRW